MERFDPSVFAPLALGILAFLLLSAASTDLKQHRIPNKLVFMGAALGCFLNAVLPKGFGFVSSMPGALGLWSALAGMALGLVIMLPLYALRAMGAGDVKLMAMVGAFLGPNGMLGTIILSFLLGALMSVVVVIRLGSTRRFIDNLKAMLLLAHIRMKTGQRPTLDAAGVSAGKLPYALAIAAGTFTYVVLALRGEMDFLKIF